MITQGAEAIIEKVNSNILKTRIKKSYRHESIDQSLRSFRTRREAKILKTLQEKNFPSPKLISSNDKDMIIELDFIDGEKLRDIFENSPLEYAKQIGETVAQLHNLEIVHGDLTTSNMILNQNQVYLIDFGLSFFSQKIEDKAVDLHLLKQALESSHHTVFRCVHSAFQW